MVKTLVVGYAPHSQAGNFNGAGFLTQDISSRLSREKGHDIHYLSYAGTSLDATTFDFITHHTLPQSNVDVASCPYERTVPDLMTAQIVDLHRRERFDIIHAHEAIVHAQAAVQAAEIIAFENGGVKPKVIVTLHGEDVNRFGRDQSYKIPLRHALSKADYLIFASQGLYDNAQNFGLFPSGRDSDVVIPNFVDTEEFNRDRCGYKRSEIRQQYGIGEEDLVFYHASNFATVKRAQLIVDSFAQAVSQSKDLNSKLFMIGGNGNKNALETYTRGLDLEGRIIFTQGSLVDKGQMPAHHAAGDVLVSASENEGFGGTGAEALATSNYIVGTNVGEFPNFITDKTGLSFDVDDTSALTDHMISVINDRGRVKQARPFCRSKALDYTPHRVISMYDDIYLRI